MLRTTVVIAPHAPETFVITAQIARRIRRIPLTIARRSLTHAQPS
jgi:hypothetical protein